VSSCPLKRATLPPRRPRVSLRRRPPSRPLLDPARPPPPARRFVFGLIGLPFGLFMVVVTGADLFTGNVGFTLAAAWAGKIGYLEMLRCWAVSWLSNFAGSLVVVGLIVASGTHEDHHGAMIVAEKKCSHGFGEVVARGVFCNWLVNMALFQALAANTFSGKFLGVLFPIAAFVTMGFDHAVANMTLIPMGMAVGSDVSVGDMIVKNLVPATIGNILGGSVLVTGLLGLAYDRIPGAVLGDLVPRISRKPAGTMRRELSTRAVPSKA